MGKNNLEDWLWQLTHNFKLSHVPKNEWVLVAGSYVKGFALTTYRTITRTTKGQSQITWPDFVKRYWKANTPKNYQLDLRERLANLKQTGNINKC